MSLMEKQYGQTGKFPKKPEKNFRIGVEKLGMVG